MSVADRVRSARLALAAGAVVRALVWGATAGISVILVGAAADLLVPLSVATRSALLSVAVGAALATVAALAWRDRRVLSTQRVALWIEERFPSLEYGLVTAVESGDERFVPPSPCDWSAAARRRAFTALAAPAAALTIAVAIVRLLPRGAVARARSPRPGDALERPAGGTRANRLAPLVAEVAPPAYSGQRATTIDEPHDVSAMVGSRVTLRGRGGGAGIVARLSRDSSVAAVTSNDRWSITLQVSARPMVARLRDGGNRRIVAVEPVPDQAPVATLVAPPHDSVLRMPTGRIPLAADLSDDIGLAGGAFEYIVSSGEGETFRFKSGTIGARPMSGRTASLSASISIDSLHLGPGDILHVRAVARDANDVTGPGVGASETRSIRIARPDEYDSVAVEAAAPSEADRSMVSERMLIMLAEALQQKRPRLGRDTVLRESQGIAVDQKKLRRAVGDIVFTRLGGNPSAEETNDEENPRRAKSIAELLRRADSATSRAADPIDFEGGESPVVAVNQPLLEAYNAMWDASLGLEMGEPDRALPHMRRALAAIQRARQAERLYLRGVTPTVVIDIDKARLKGKDQGASSARRPATSPDTAAIARADRFTRIVELAARHPRSAIDSLLVLRIDALADAPAFAAALGDAVTAMRGGRGDAATSALARARRALAGSPTARDSLSRWGLVP